MILLRKSTDPGDPYSYQIESVDTEDTGLYSCVAGNILGETRQETFLNVSSAPPSLPPALLLSSLSLTITSLHIIELRNNN